MLIHPDALGKHNPVKRKMLTMDKNIPSRRNPNKRKQEIKRRRLTSLNPQMHTIRMMGLIIWMLEQYHDLSEKPFKALERKATRYGYRRKRYHIHDHTFTIEIHLTPKTWKDPEKK